jgi:DNA-binding GntR family transcriptional regulator
MPTESHRQARKAIELLRERGLVVTVTGRGTYVIPPAE